MKSKYDLIIIGAGPAGLSAASWAARYDLSVLVLGEQSQPGGQVYRNIERVDPRAADILGPDYRQGTNLVQSFRRADIDYLPGAVVWHASAPPHGTVCFIYQGRAFQRRTSRIIIATGARERPLALPGWTLPGVMAVTAAEVLLKSQGLIPQGPIVLAGSGPLLFLTTSRLIAAGADVKAVLETTPAANYRAAWPFLFRAVAGAEYLFKGLAMIRRIRRSGVPIYRQVESLAAEGRESLERVRFEKAGAIRELTAEYLLVHHGLVPDTQISSLLDCRHEWSEVQRYWRPVADRWGNTSLAGVGVAGDAAGIAGAKAAPISGQLTALEAACALGRITRRERDSQGTPLLRQNAREARARTFLDHLFRPNPDLLVPRDPDTLVCRCEEITVGQLVKALETEPADPNKVKAQTRCGMGPCQGRMCGPTLSELIARHRSEEVSKVGYFRIRPPLNQITLEQLAELQLADQAENGHEGA